MVPLKKSTLFSLLVSVRGFLIPSLSMRTPQIQRMFSSSSSSIVIQEDRVPLSTNVTMQVLSCLPKEDTDRPVILFLHGSFHAAWCWTERFFPYFVDKGYPVCALSWRGTGGTRAAEGVKKVKIMEHVEDLSSILSQLPSITKRGVAKPVLVSHSFGGLAVMKLLETYPDISNDLAGICTMCSVPPSGNGKMTMRFLRRSLVQSWRITKGFAMKKCITDPSLCRRLFFGGDKVVRDDGTEDDYGVLDSDIVRYQQYFERDTEATIDLFDLAKQLPSDACIDGRAPFVSQLPPCLVIGAKDDYIVDWEGNVETAKYFGLEAPTYVDSPHDVMLGRKWQNAADALDEWITRSIQ